MADPADGCPRVRERNDVPASLAPAEAPRVAILLSVFNGERFLAEQLASLLSQTQDSWRLYWRDDGSSDGSQALVRAFAAGPAGARVREVTTPAGRLGALQSFLTLVRAAPPGAAVAFADQDDVWLPEKLERGLAAFAAVPAELPALYCAPQILVDRRLVRRGVSGRIRRRPGFPAALTQNVVTGCTAMLNPPAAGLVAKSRPPESTLHDWWSYLVVAAAGGRVLADREPSVLYRQHDDNLVGAGAGRLERGWRALVRGPRPFMTLLREHAAALGAVPELLSPDAAAALGEIAGALAKPPWRRLSALALPGLVRQTPLETALFRLWFLLG